MNERSTAAFYRVEGTLVGRPTLAAAAWFAANAQGVGERVARLGNVALAAPFAIAGSLVTGSAGTRMTWMGLRGLLEDRLEILAEEYYEEFVRPSVLAVGRDLLEKSRRRGQRVVLISDNIDLVMRPLCRELRADDLVCNQLEIRRGAATGRLCEPVIGGNLAGQWARGFADQHRIDLDRSCAYGAAAADSLLLSAIGQPCAVNPDRQLRRLARDHDWPVVDA